MKLLGVFLSGVEGGRRGGGYHISGNKMENLFPDDRKVCLDKNVLSKIYLTRERIKTIDAFYPH